MIRPDASIVPAKLAPSTGGQVKAPTKLNLAMIEAHAIIAAHYD